MPIMKEITTATGKKVIRTNDDLIVTDTPRPRRKKGGGILLAGEKKKKGQGLPGDLIKYLPLASAIAQPFLQKGSEYLARKLTPAPAPPPPQLQPMMRPKKRGQRTRRRR